MANNITQKLKSLLYKFLELSMFDKIGFIFINIMLWIIMPIVIYWGVAFSKEMYMAVKNYNESYDMTKFKCAWNMKVPIKNNQD